MAKARSRSPKAPSIALPQALEKAMQLYSKERLHSVPIDVAAQDLGYSSANNGSALRTMATLKMYGLAHAPAKGQLAVAKEVEDYRFNPSDQEKGELIRQWITRPQVFSELLERYQENLPSEKALTHKLISELNFSPKAAEGVVSSLNESLAFLRESGAEPINDDVDEGSGDGSDGSKEDEPDLGNGRTTVGTMPPTSGYDRIPVRLRGGRRAWLEVPTPFYEEDKDLLKRQIDLILTDSDLDEIDESDEPKS